MTTQELKQRIAECLDRELNHQVLNNLLRDCLKHIEELEGEVTHMRQRIHDLGPTVQDNQISQLQSQLREREADCAAMRGLLQQWLGICKPFREEASQRQASLIENALSGTAGRDLLERLQKAESVLLKVREIGELANWHKCSDHAWPEYRAMLLINEALQKDIDTINTRT